LQRGANCSVPNFKKRRGVYKYVQKFSGARKNKHRQSKTLRSKEEKIEVFQTVQQQRGTQRGIPKMIRSEEKRTQAFHNFSGAKRNKER